MTVALEPSAYVFEGLWTNWTKGSIRGLTLTLSPTHATLLTNILALFVTFAGGQIWTLLRFGLHQARLRSLAVDSRKDTPSDRQQVILSNTTTDMATAQFMLSLVWTTRRTTPSHTNAVLIVILAVFHATLFIVAGAFSGTIAGAGSKVASRSPYCGVFNTTYLNLMDGGPNAASKEIFAQSAQWYAKLSDEIQLSLEYAQKCYLDPDTYAASSTCEVLPQPTIRYNTTVTKGACPFKDGICHDLSDMIVFDTGPIDSHSDLGINAGYHERLTYQRLTECAVLNNTGRVTGWNNTTSITGNTQQPAQNIAYAYYGPNLEEETEFTYSYSNPTSFSTNFTPQVEKPYKVNAQWAWAQDGNARDSTFSPIPELEHESADTILFFLTFVGNYIDQVDDPWFSAHRLHLEDTNALLARRQYARDEPIGTIGCTERHKYCTTNGTCTPYLGMQQVLNVPSFNSVLTPYQNATFDRLTSAVGDGSLEDIAGLATLDMPMLANDYTLTESHTLSLALPSSQWQHELGFWHSIAMARLQRSIVQRGTGQIAPDLRYMLSPTTEQDKWFCKSLMIPSSIYQSFSVLALVLIAVFGSLIILVSLWIEEVATRLRKICGWNLTPQQNWDDDSMLRLQERLEEQHMLRRPPPRPKDCHTVESLCRQIRRYHPVAPPPYQSQRSFRTGKMHDQVTCSPAEEAWI